MKRTRPFMFLIICMLHICFSAVWAQNSNQKTKSVSGKVTDVSQDPLIGVSVVVKETNIGTITDSKGNFKINVPTNKKTLVFSYTGFDAIETEIKGNTMDIVLLEKVSELDEVVVVGYGSTKKRDITGAISSVRAEEIAKESATNIFDALQNKVAGVEIVSNSGAPGADSEVRVRGTATFEGGAKPLYVVDGVVYESLEDVNPDDIESIEVLKDAASASIYGSRSANGVFLVTTKQGQKAKSSVSVRYLRSYSSLSYNMPKANAAERQYYDRVRRQWSSIRNTEVYGYAPIVDSLCFFTNQDLDLQNYIFRTSTRDEVSLSANGASDQFKVYLNASYLSDKGIIVNSDYNRLTSRINIDYTPNDKLTLGTKTYFSISNQSGISEDGVLNQLNSRTPYWAIFNPDGSYIPQISNVRNPFAVAMTDIDQRQRYNVTLYEYLTYKFNKYLRFLANIQGSYSHSRDQEFRPSAQLTSTQRTTGRDLTRLSYNWTNEEYFEYKRTFNSVHNVVGMLGASFQSWNRENVNLVGYDYTTDELYTLNAASGFDAKASYTTISRHTMASFFGRLGYNFKGKYIFNSNLRYDGSSRFGKDSRWGLFPSVSVAWRFSDENFTSFMKPFVSDAKIRYSYGITGNEEIADYASQFVYSPNYIYQGVAGIAPSNLAFSELSWEETSQRNVGLDLFLLKNKIKIIVDAYSKLTDKLLNKVELPKETGFSSIQKNIGAMRNDGFEISINWNVIKTRKIKWDVDFNFSHNLSVITNISDNIPFYKGTDEAIYIQEGKRLGEFYGYKYLGIFAYDQSNAYDTEWNQLNPVFDENLSFMHYTLNGDVYSGIINQKKSSDGNPLLGGDVNLYDANSDGIINILDKSLIGCAQADFYGGFGTSFTYRDLSLQMSFAYSVGGQIYNYTEARRNRFQQDGTTPSPIAINNMWTKQGDNAIYPVPVIKEHNFLAPSDFYLQDASYLKLRNVRLDYSFPKKLTKSLKIGNISCYIYGKNLLTFTDYKGYDPVFSSSSDPLSIGIDTGKYPRKREYGFGLKLDI